MALAKEYIALMHKDLNQKITEWVGFEWWEDGQLYTFGKDWLSRELPDFTVSLDDLFEWVVPKTREKGFMLNVSSGMLAPNTTVTLYKSKKETYQGFSETPALALCYAVEQLIGVTSNA